LKWSPDGRVIAVWDHLLEYKIAFYSPDGRCLRIYRPSMEQGLGIRTMQFAPSGQGCLVGSWEPKVRFLNHYTWNALFEVEHPTILKDDTVR
jgi:hypothetical protein